MLRGKRAVVGMLLSFMTGGLLVGGLVLIGQPSSLVPPAHADAAQPKPPQGTPPTPWLKGTTDEKFAQIERHLRGLDVTMAEIGYRYSELLLAGKTRNWEYAQYQTEKIEFSLRLGVERRPKRAKSTEPFLKDSIPPVMEAIKAKNGEKLDVALKGLHVGCIQCHRAENVLYMGQLFATIQPTPPATAKAIQEYKNKLTPDYLRGADRSQGRLVFSKDCATCHRLFGEGTDNGPDLTGLQRSNLDYLLTTIIAPNAVIGHDYQAIVVVTKKGLTITGLVKHEDQKTLTIQTPTEKVIIPKEEIEERSVSKVSFMPEGILQKLSDEQVRDLIGYLQGPIQVPLPPAKKLDMDPKKSKPKTLLIEPGELQKKLRQPGLRILDTRPQAEYAKGHVPGAIPVDVKSWQDLGKKESGFHDAKVWGEKVGQLGISHDSQVVVYGSNLTDTARIWWTLKYLGVQNVTILNGGWQLWNKEKQATDTEPTKIDAVKFEPKLQDDRMEEIDSLKKAVQSGKATVVDARSADEFTGKEIRGKRGGHIAGAKHLEWKELLAEDGRFKSPEQLRQLFRQRGITPDQTAVTC